MTSAQALPFDRLTTHNIRATATQQGLSLCLNFHECGIRLNDWLVFFVVCISGFCSLAGVFGAVGLSVPLRSLSRLRMTRLERFACMTLRFLGALAPKRRTSGAPAPGALQ